MRKIVVDTETTGLAVSEGHRIIEVGCVEIVERRLTDQTFHYHLNPEREIDEAATEIHGKTWNDLENQSKFADIADELLNFIDGAELVIHNAPFDVGFLNNEFKLAGKGGDLIKKHCTVLDTLIMARRKLPGKPHKLDNLCTHYSIDNSARTLHGALLDAELLADVYLAMTVGQSSLLGDTESLFGENNEPLGNTEINGEMAKTPIIRANAEELEQHKKFTRTLLGNISEQ